MTKKLLVSKWPTKDPDEKEAAKLGAELLTSKNIAIVKYRRKKWFVKDLLKHLAEEVIELEQKQCRPDAGCIFVGQDYLDQKYLTEDWTEE